MKRMITGLWVCLAGLCPAAEPAGYYARSEGLSGDALASALHDVIDGHRVFSYSEARDILKIIDLSERVPRASE